MAGGEAIRTNTVPPTVRTVSPDAAPRVAIVTVGDEILTGDTINTNAAWLGRRLTEVGADVERIVVVGDELEEIVRILTEYRAAFESVITTGGLGPTHDDVTMEAVAAAFGRPMEEHPEAIEWLLEEGGYTREDLVTGTADLPRGARALHNEAGVAPGAVVDNVYVLPGVPAEMKAMFEHIEEEFVGVQRYTAEIETEEPESALIERMNEVQDRFGVRVGSYPGDTVRIKLVGRDPATVDKAAAWLRANVEDIVES